MIAWVTSSELTTAPIVVRLRCSAIGPSCFCRAAATSPSLPLVGIWVLPTGPADADGDGDAPGEADGPADAEADGPADAEADALGATLAPALALAPAPPDGAAEPALELGARVATGVAAGWFCPTICWVLISMKPEPVATALASRPWAAKTALTWSGVTAGSWKRTSHFVPPV